jgi:hypothetical protein
MSKLVICIIAPNTRALASLDAAEVMLDKEPRHNLPGKAPPVLEPSALARLAAFGHMARKAVNLDEPATDCAFALCAKWRHKPMPADKFNKPIAIFETGGEQNR